MLETHTITELEPGVFKSNGWLLTFELNHSGDYASVTSGSREALERIISGPYREV